MEDEVFSDYNLAREVDRIKSEKKPEPKKGFMYFIKKFWNKILNK